MSTAPAARDYGRYEVWAPRARAVDVRVDGTVHAMTSRHDGWWELASLSAVPGARYAFRVQDGGVQGGSAATEELPWLPDPRGLLLDGGVDGESVVVDPARLEHDPTWGGIDLRGTVLYELHAGTFAPPPDGGPGTLDTAIDRLDELVELGIEAVELMPLAPFPGDRGWGYDGVGVYGVHAAYGGPAALARFVAAAHRRGLGVVLDVVHNHLGPAGNHLSRFGPYFTDAHHTPWGQAVNLDGPGSEEVRAFLLGSMRQWCADFGIDGLRLDAVHELHDTSDRHLLAEMADARDALGAELGRPLALIAESDRNDPGTVTPVAAGGLGMDMQWADDVHHGVHAWITGERQGYYADFGSAPVLARVLTRVFEHAGTFSSFRGAVWGSPVDPACPHYDGRSFVVFLQNHDQVGNRAAGDRIHAHLSPGEHAAAIAPILLGPFTPMLFQGEEFAASAPFAYFTDHEAELGAAVTRGRTAEFSRMGWGDAVPDPQAESTARASRLDWAEARRGAHARMREWYRTLLRLRRAEPALHGAELRDTRCEVLAEETILLRRRAPAAGEVLVLIHRGASRAELPASDAEGAVLLASSQAVLDGAPESSGALHLDGPGVLVLRRG
ncbi:malto-oligosyltrehalose trehalohydrolase [Brachybacterium hainanense]|uniref:Malto-oligosyltrehalose trehalohydrolase n=1 Tax=Brachybacterium hainanense TaxID=1541174 RepID=A0ABV6REJ2_9MICO